MDYQVWLTVLAWIELDEDDLLVIEGVEDFDVITSDTGLTVQVKAIADPISLRSESVIKAIRNYWQSKHENRSFRIRFKFVTTATEAVEAGEPFGMGVAGLVLWNDCATDLEGNVKTVDAIRQFLLSDRSIRPRLEAAFPANIPSVAEFLLKASIQQVADHLISPIHWAFREGGVEAARESVQNSPPCIW